MTEGKVKTSSKPKARQTHKSQLNSRSSGSPNQKHTVIKVTSGTEKKWAPGNEADSHRSKSLEVTGDNTEQSYLFIF